MWSNVYLKCFERVGSSVCVCIEPERERNRVCVRLKQCFCEMFQESGIKSSVCVIERETVYVHCAAMFPWMFKDGRIKVPNFFLCVWKRERDRESVCVCVYTVSNVSVKCLKKAGSKPHHPFNFLNLHTNPGMDLRCFCQKNVQKHLFLFGTCFKYQRNFILRFL